eukprot:114392_1
MNEIYYESDRVILAKKFCGLFITRNGKQLWMLFRFGRLGKFMRCLVSFGMNQKNQFGMKLEMKCYYTKLKNHGVIDIIIDYDCDGFYVLLEDAHNGDRGALLYYDLNDQEKANRPPKYSKEIKRMHRIRMIPIYFNTKALQSAYQYLHQYNE